MWESGGLRWRNASPNPHARAAAQCQVSVCEWACVTVVSPRPGQSGHRKLGERETCHDGALAGKREEQTLEMERKKESSWESRIKCWPRLPAGRLRHCLASTRLLCPEWEPICREFVPLPLISPTLVQTAWHFYAWRLLSQHQSPTCTGSPPSHKASHNGISIRRTFSKVLFYFLKLSPGPPKNPADLFVMFGEFRENAGNWEASSQSSWFLFIFKHLFVDFNKSKLT